MCLPEGPAINKPVCVCVVCVCVCVCVCVWCVCVCVVCGVCGCENRPQGLLSSAERELLS